MIFHILFNYNQSNQVMDEKIQKVLEEKIHESTNRINEITLLVNSLGKAKNPDVFGRGIIIGRLYNSFYYQSRRILKRNPTEQEFSEFIQLLKEHENELEISFS
jgi:4-hydroxy-3-methylbut-2-en-1-yl diphosphate synthase IspG/GcpE